MLKEAAKQRLARWGNAKYAMHGPNETLRQTVLRDGRPVYEFMRCNPHWGGVSSRDQGRHIDKVLTGEMLNRLVERGGTCVLYTHLGKIDDPKAPFKADAVGAFRRLAEEFRAGRILVTTTRRLLGYRRAVSEVGFCCTCDEMGLQIDVTVKADGTSGHSLSEADLNGLTFYVDDPENTRVTVTGKEVANLKCNPRDHTRRPSVSIPWPGLEFPQI